MKTSELDLVLIVSELNRGWILETICREIAQHYPGKTVLHYSLHSLPKARVYFFSHYSLFDACLRRNPLLRFRRTLVFFTHPGYRAVDAPRVARQLRKASAIVSMSSMHVPGLVTDGVPAEKIHVVLPGTDPERFIPDDSDRVGAVGFCSAYYPRKEPERIATLVRAMPARHFLLIGKGWADWAGFAALRTEPNFTYVEPKYEDYPRHYAAMDVFVSPSRLEGGPVPLLEAMMANVVPVCSRTGFGPDLIEHGHNGFLFDVDAPIEIIYDLIEQAFNLQTNIRATVQDRTWQSFSAGIRAIAEKLG